MVDLHHEVKRGTWGAIGRFVHCAAARVSSQIFRAVLLLLPPTPRFLSHTHLLPYKTQDRMSTTYKVADISLAAWGRKEMVSRAR